MSRTALCLATAVASLSGASAFVPSNAVASFTGARTAICYAPAGSATRTVLKAVASDATRKPVLITGNNLEVTPALMEHVNKKIDAVVDKLGGSVTKVDVHLSVNKNPRIADNHNAEVTVFAKGHHVVRATERSDNMYASIDAVADTIARKLRKFKERTVDAKRSRVATSEIAGEKEAAYQASTSADEAVEYSSDDLPQPDMSVVKSKSFPMPPCSVEDAVVALEYIDHDFYVFRNSATNEVNVVYKRNHGGVGHIEPERD